MKVETGHGTTIEAARSLVRKLLAEGGYGDSNGRPPQFDGDRVVRWPDGSQIQFECDVTGRYVDAITGGYEAQQRRCLGAARLARDLVMRLMVP